MVKVKTENEKEIKDKSASNLKLISTNTGTRVSQACDRCRIKKIKCDGLYPCHNCNKIGFECRTSDKLTRRAFPKGYTENLEKKLKELEQEMIDLKAKYGIVDDAGNSEVGAGGAVNSLSVNDTSVANTPNNTFTPSTSNVHNPNSSDDKVLLTTTNQTVQINNPIDQIFNLDNKGIIIGNDNLNFESQFNHLLINLNLPFLKITNSHNYLLNDPNSYLYHPSYHNYNQFHNKDLDVIYNPLTGNSNVNEFSLVNNQLPTDIYDLFIKLINNFKKLFNNKKELDNQIIQFFLNYNIFLPIFDYKQFMESYDAFHTMYPFIFTYDDSTINGFNLSNSNDYHIVNQYLMIIIQIYAMIYMNNPTINLNLLLNHSDPNYTFHKKSPKDNSPNIIKSLYDFLPYFNVFHVSVNQLQTYLLFLYYSLLTNNKEKSLILSSLINSFIGILGINLNSKNLFFDDLSLNTLQRRNRVKTFWVFKVLLKCFNLKFGFKPSLNTTVINPVTIDKYFQLTPEKLSTLLDNSDDLFNTLLKPSIEFLNLMNIIIPSSFAPNYYEYLKNKKKKKDPNHQHHTKHLDWILKEDDGEGNDGNLNYNYAQFLTIDKNLSNWRNSLKTKTINLLPLADEMGLPNISNISSNDLFHELRTGKLSSGITHEGLLNYYSTGIPDIYTASQLIKIQLNFHYILIRSMNYLNFIVDKELTYPYYIEISHISREVLHYFLFIFDHINKSNEKTIDPTPSSSNIVMESLGLDVDEDGFVINDFSVKRRKTNGSDRHNIAKRITKEIPPSPFNYMLNGLSMTIINFKKSMILQLLFLLICQLKFFKRNDFDLISDSIPLLNESVELFIKIFINYKVGVNRKDPKKVKEDKLFEKLMNDQLRDEILKDQADSDFDDDDEASNAYQSIDWDDEEMDEDLKYLKILKFVKYKSNDILNKLIGKNSSSVPEPSQVTHHHHVEQPSQLHVHPHIDSNRSSLSKPTGPPILPPPVINNFYANSPSAGSPGLGSFNKIPSMSKFDFLLSDNDYSNQAKSQSHTPQDYELAKKEKLVINDLMNLRHGSQGSNKYPGPSSNPNWIHSSSNSNTNGYNGSGH
ncbi:zinc finger transcription factor [Scheffersomyces stipitis CBS 6054]|uniref:Zinc finger transcription factor n=1 Tax=Scheffersomyces stipitis (strain ATCC 58785 / CBS 6054 / NBRC 10063 / NRRL Y-11545) TaxID=322104 RepID=A3LUG4_PICST|nr:zinc finger transcription factor [Scheffersomyces stipitis CBS 6054]ABN66234.2 zinc finger transcription factor [Scheffersomyces stipitis CBS 6054]